VWRNRRAIVAAVCAIGSGWRELSGVQELLRCEAANLPALLHAWYTTYFSGMLVGYRLCYCVPLLEQNDCHFAQSKGFCAVPKIGLCLML